MTERRVYIPEQKSDNQCLTCNKASVCKYKESYMETYQRIAKMVDSPQPFKIKLECQYYDTGNKFGTYRSGSGTGQTTSIYAVQKDV
jgi:hypothetical protein